VFQSLEEYLTYKIFKEEHKEGRKEGRKEAQEELLARLIELEILNESQLTKIVPMLGLIDASGFLDKMALKKRVTFSDTAKPFAV